MIPRKYRTNGEGARKLYSHVSSIIRNPENPSWSFIGRWTSPIETDVIYPSDREAVKVNYNRDRSNHDFSGASLELYDFTPSQRGSLGNSILFLEEFLNIDIFEVSPKLDLPSPIGTQN